MLWQLLVLGLAMGMNNALAAVAFGTQPLARRTQLKVALTFGVFEAVMPLIGLAIGAGLSNLVGRYATYLGVGVLVVMGLYLLLKPTGSEESNHSISGVRGLVMAGALSLDNLTVGFGLGMLRVPLALAAVVFGVVSVVLTLVGLEIGRIVGTRLNVSADKLSGGLLIVVAGLLLFVP